jgi:hypothetical protein
MNWTSFSRFTTLLGFAFILPLVTTRPSLANDFTETAIDQTEVIAIARPYGTETTKYDLLVIEQIPNKKQCWQTSGSAPALVDPLLMNYDFTGHCRRATDSNGYSVRIDGEDYGLEYLLRIVPRGNELVLIATSRSGKAPELVLGSTKGMATGFMQIQLNPGWQLSKRTYQGKVLGHFYISGSQANILQPGVTPSPSETPVQPTPPSSVQPDPVSPDPVQPDPVQPKVPAVSNESQVPAVEVETEVMVETDTELMESQGEEITEQTTTVVEETIIEAPTITPRPRPQQSSRRPSPTPDDFRRF